MTESKSNLIIKKLRSGWSDVPAMLAETGWKTHTLRGAISAASRRFGLKIERKRENGVTSYRAFEQ